MVRLSRRSNPLSPTIGDGDEVYRQARELIPMMKARIDDALTEKDKRDIIDSLVW